MPAEAGTLRTTLRNIDVPPGCAQHGASGARSIDPLPACRAARKPRNTIAQAVGQLARLLNSSEIVDRFQSFLSAFSGPATKHPGNYAWFDAHLRASNDGCRRQVCRAALDAPSTRAPTQFWDMLNLADAGQQQRRAAARHAG